MVMVEEKGFVQAWKGRVVYLVQQVGEPAEAPAHVVVGGGGHVGQIQKL